MNERLRVPRLLAVVVLAAEASACSADTDSPEPCRTRIETDGAIVRTGACDAGASDATEDLDGIV
jgi:hypothetical protein